MNERVAHLTESSRGALDAVRQPQAATDALVGTISTALAPHRVNVNSIHPGWIDTEGERQFTSEAELVACGKHLPFGLGRPSDIAKGALYLASEDADYVTGRVTHR
jgi:glucose 1-dehydrogenase